MASVTMGTVSGAEVVVGGDARLFQKVKILGSKIQKIKKKILPQIIPKIAIPTNNTHTIK